MEFHGIKALGMVFCQLLYFLSKFAVASLQTILHYFDGTSARRENIRKGTDTSGCVAEVSRVLGKFPGLGMSVASHSHFLCWHERFVDVSYLLKPNITLYFLNADQAIFVECPPEVNIYDTKRYPFYFLAQRLNCQKVISITLTEFVKLGKKIGDPKCDVGWIFHTNRCGSTAVVQGLNAVPNCTVISESQDLLVHLSTMGLGSGVNFEDYLKSETFKEILLSSIAFVFKNFQDGQFVCMKTTGSLNYLLISTIASLFPNHRFISMHRDGLGTAKSFWRMASDHVGLTLGLFVVNTFPSSLTGPLRQSTFMFSNGMLSEVESYHGKDFNLFVFLFSQWVTNIVTFQRNTQSLKLRLLPIFYDDFQADKHQVMLQVFDQFSISKEHIQTALNAMEGDSQVGTPMDRNLLHAKRPWIRDERTVDICNTMLKQFGLPDFDQKFRFNSNLDIEVIQQ